MCLSKRILSYSGFILLMSAYSLGAVTNVPDIVPWPKEIRFGKHYWELPAGNSSGTILVLGRNASAQSRIGAERLSAALKKVGSNSIICDETEQIPSETGCVFYIGTVGENSLLTRKLKSHRINITADNPGVQGYVISFRQDKGVRTVLLAGSDHLGTLYSCVTAEYLVSMQDSKPVILPTEVRDWPDIKNRWLGNPQWHGGASDRYDLFQRGWDEPESKRFNITARKHIEDGMAYVDWLLKRKINGMRSFTEISGMFVDDMPQAARKAIREINEYALARGVKPFLMQNSELIPSKAAKQYSRSDWWKNINLDKKVVGSGRDSRFCWSRDDLILQRARAIGQYMKDTAMPAVWIHAIDTGGYQDPEVWSNRCENCKKRWGDDRLSASANAWELFVKGIREKCPEAVVIPILYPYMITILDEKFPKSGYSWSGSINREEVLEKTIDYWKGIAKALPPDIPLLIRESSYDAVTRFRELVKPHPLFTYFQPSHHLAWQPVFTTSIRYMKTFKGDERDIVWLSDPANSEPTFFGAAEYAWNTEAPCADYFQQWLAADGEQPVEIIENLLPRLCRNVWGTELGNLLTEVFASNVSFAYLNYPYDTRNWVLSYTPDLKNEDVDRMCQQYMGAAKAVAAIDKVWEKLTGPNSKELLSNLTSFDVCRLYERYLNMHAAYWVASGRFNLWKARQLIKSGDMEGGRKHIQAGLMAVEEAPADMEKAFKAVAAGSRTMPARVNRSRKDKLYNFDFSLLEKDLNELNARIHKLAGLKWPEKARAEILFRNIKATRVDTAVKIDGLLNDEAWRHAPVVQYFVSYPGNDNLDFPSAETRARLLYDDKFLYVGFNCFGNGKSSSPVIKTDTPRDGNLWNGQDSIELFLNPGKNRIDYVQIALTAQPALFDSRVGPGWSGATGTEWNGAIQAATHVEGPDWTAEIAIPFSDLGCTPDIGDRWGILLSRNIGSGEKIESSTIIPISKNIGFRDPQVYPTLTFVGSQPSCQPVHVDIQVDKPVISVQTFTDRVASVVDLNVQVETDAILHNSKLVIYACDLQGMKLPGIQKEIDIGCIPFRWKNPNPVVLVLDREREAVQLKMSFSCNETGYEKSLTVRSQK